MSKKLEPYRIPLDELIHIFEGCKLVSDHFTPEAVTAAYVEGLAALHARRAATEANETCTDCSGITYRQTASGKVVPASHICPSKITPPCYQPDGDGCAYQTYGDGGEPIDKCKKCPHCYTDKVRHEANEAPTNGGRIRAMSDEELACFLSEMADTCERNTECNQHCYGCDEMFCELDNCLKWITQPVQEE